ncbi:hypothetical protein N0V93_009232 [Gnomoniopsis smithogilvyi]|uniref:Probable glucan endo-1,3-beta-glucosidase eglC n=1 Tax=Gnomoniopsis smithogilvyi TaxID=1191159 RepID=A0A9W9CTH7_9PEZI|nr:hypothetical protein N0V93_009232 [Gnomoniopsis smithogilvyi]
MKQLNLLLLLVTIIPTPTAAWYRGFNFKSYTADGITCKNRSDWEYDFSSVKKLPNGINAARLFHAYDCDSLVNAVPEAINNGMQILAGLDDSDANFSAEKGALLAAISKHGWDWLLGVAVGSESLYRGTISPDSLAEKIWDVKGMLRKLPGYTSSVEVGHVDTTNAWFDHTNDPVMVACDFIGVDIYPYFQTEDNNHIYNAGQLFNNAISQAMTSVTAAGSKASVWVTETGWPVTGSSLGAAVPGVENAASYFQQVACPSFDRMNTFWFTYQDWFASPSFAVVNADGQQYFSQTCLST